MTEQEQNVAPAATVVITDAGFESLDAEREILGKAGHRLTVAACRTQDDVIRAGRGADALIVQWAPVTAEVIKSLPMCRLIVRYGIGVDNVDVAAADAAGIPVCNVPDYCIDEVADHAAALALALARRIPQVDARLRAGVWKIVPDGALPSFRASTFGVFGLGRVARGLLERVAPFGFDLIAFDPFVDDAPSSKIELVDFDTLLKRSDVLSLHAPLTEKTRGLFDRTAFARMKPTAILINTSRGGLVDLDDLAAALASGWLGGAGLDVYEEEPLPDSHAIRGAPGTILTSHIAWYSDASVPRLQRMAAEEVVRGLAGRPLLNPVGELRSCAPALRI